MSSNFFLSQSYGFSSGDINTGAAGNGWSTNTQLYFNIVDKLYEINVNTGIIIDLYDLVLMNPFISCDFLVDVSSINQNYIKIIQENNLLYIIPNGPKLLNDRYNLNDMIQLQVFINCLGIDYIGNLQFGFSNSPISQNYNLTYEVMEYGIPLQTLFKGCSTIPNNILEHIKINYISNISPETRGVDLNSLIANGKLNLKAISNIVNPEIWYSIDYNGIFESGVVKFENKISGYKVETEIQDIQITINPCNGEFIDITNYVVGDKFGIELFEGSKIMPETRAFKLSTTGQFISVIPNTLEIQKLDVLQTFKVIFHFKTEKTKGVFTLTILVDPAKLTFPQSVIDVLSPDHSDKTLHICNGEFTYNKPLDISPILNNRPFYPDDNFRILSISGDSNIDFDNVGGPRIFNLPNTKITGTNLLITYEFKSNTYTSKLIFVKEDKLYRENFEVTPIIFNISPNYFNTVNLFDHVQVDGDQYKNLVFEFDQANNFISATYPIELVAPSEAITTQKTGIIKVKNPTTYTNNFNVDGYGRIIGYREIPYQINIHTTPGPVDYIVPEDLIFYLDNFKVVEIRSSVLNIPHYLSNKSKITSVSLDVANTTTDIIFAQAGTQPIIDKFTIKVSSDHSFILLFIDSGTKPLQNTKIVLILEYQKDDGTKVSYFQTIKFLKKGI